MPNGSFTSLGSSFDERKSQNEIFSKRLTEAFKECHKSRKEIVNETHISNNALTSYFSGEKAPSCFTFKKLAKCLGVSYEYLYGECKAKNPGYVNASKLLGLSNKSINAIKKINALSETCGWDIAEYVLSNPLFISILSQLADIGRYAQNNHEEYLPIDDIGVIPISQMGGVEEILLSIHRGADLLGLTNDKNEPLQAAMQKRFGSDSVIVSAKEAIRSISQTRAQKALGLLMDKIIADAEDNNLPDNKVIKIKEDDDVIQILLRNVSHKLTDSVDNGMISGRPHLDLLTDILRWKNDVEDGLKTRQDFFKWLKAIERNTIN